jgi:hypothetical protein
MMPNLAGGSVLTVLFSVLMGGMSLGQAAPLLQVCYMTTRGKAASAVQQIAHNCQCHTAAPLVHDSALSHPLQHFITGKTAGARVWKVPT